MSLNGPSSSSSERGSPTSIFPRISFERGSHGTSLPAQPVLDAEWGGEVPEYLPPHSWFDQSKSIAADLRHRALRHYAEGILRLETVIGPTLTLSTGKLIPTRLSGREHVKEDLGFIRSLGPQQRQRPARKECEPGVQKESAPVCRSTRSRRPPCARSSSMPRTERSPKPRSTARSNPCRRSSVD
jgi:hypothetical protein